MKTILDFKAKTAVAIIGLIAMIFITTPLFSQDSLPKPHKQKQVKVIVKTDVNGKSHTLDTTFNFNGTVDPAKLKKIMKEYSVDLEGLSDAMQGMAVQIDDGDSPDSAGIDSISQKIKRIRIFGGDDKHHGRPHAYTFNYNFDDEGMPEQPAPPAFGDFDRFDNWSEDAPFPGNCKEKSNTLADILGDIPMDCVKSYSIKETKNGKRIVIEVNNGPIIEHRDKVIIIREPRQHGPHGHSQAPQIRKKIIIRSDGDAPQGEKSEM